ncbi:MAG TPA: ribokinase [Terriglobales bacterium]|nr:ribokinase [Terriglobales bacterium]
MKPIVVVGSINMDLVTHVDRIPRPGETVTGTSFQIHSGGKGANQAVAIAKLGYPCILLGAVGEDVFGQNLLRTLSAYNVDITNVREVPGSSGTATIIVDSNAENCIVVTPGSNAQVTEEYVTRHEHLIRSAGIVLLQLEIPIATIEWVVRCCAENGIPVMLDPAPARALSRDVLRNLDWFTPNETEAEFYAPQTKSPSEAIEQLFAIGPRNVILKRGSQGAIVADAEGKCFHAEAFEVTAIDTTAAGDAFNGAFAVAMMRGLPFPECARFAAAAAAIAVTRCGAQPSLPTNAEVVAFMDRTTQLPAV